MIRSKKGVISELVQRIELLIAGILLLFIVGTVFVAYFNQQNETRQCQISIMLASKGQLPIKGKLIDFDCPRSTLEIEFSDVSISRNQISTQKILEIFAQETRRCNWMTGEGLLDPYEKSNLFWTNEKVCLICREITFDTRLSEAGIDPLDLYGYLSVTYMVDSSMYPNDDVSYLDYLLNNRPYIQEYNQNVEGGIDKRISDIDLASSYYVIHRLEHKELLRSRSFSLQDEVLVIPKEDITQLGCILAN